MYYYIWICKAENHVGSHEQATVNSNAKRVKWRQQQVAKEQQQALKPEPELNRVVAPRRSYRPHILRPSTIRRICHLPAEQCNSTTEAKVRYFNSKFGKCSLTVCHEDICPYTEVCKKHKKKKPKPSISMMKSIRRIVKRSARNSVIPKGKLNSRIAKKATKSP
ncbi:uncharacterized protein [Drosophila kikkawai]|uniref:Uncharacterized protein isoform X2 n=1 Tax=Drosophila kikkawai TaxID=30033 RepID=A0ABM4GD66_DROKI